MEYLLILEAAKLFKRVMTVLLEDFGIFKKPIGISRVLHVHQMHLLVDKVSRDL